MAGTGAGSGSMASTGFNFATAGTGAMGTGGSSTATNQTITGNPFGAGSINWDINNQQYNWSGNIAGVTPIVFIGDNVTGKYLPSAYKTEGSSIGSPLDMNEAIRKVIMDANAKPGGVETLKSLLQQKQMYGSQQAGANSIAQGAAFDPFFTQAIQKALNSATGVNAQIAANQGSNPKILSFDQYLANAPAGGGSYGGDGIGGTQKQIYNQKFQPEEYEIVVDQLFQKTIGRGASEEELNEFVSKLQSYADKNPEVTTRKTSGNTTSITQTGGVSSGTVEKMMRDSALANPQAEQYNKAVTYIDYFREALASPIKLGA